MIHPYYLPNTDTKLIVSHAAFYFAVQCGGHNLFQLLIDTTIKMHEKGRKQLKLTTAKNKKQFPDSLLEKEEQNWRHHVPLF